MSSEPMVRTIAPRPHLPRRPRCPARRWPPRRWKVLKPVPGKMITETLTVSGWRVSRPSPDRQQRPIPARTPLTRRRRGLPRPQRPFELLHQTRKVSALDFPITLAHDPHIVVISVTS
jgi:hypothetical protein